MSFDNKADAVDIFADLEIKQEQKDQRMFFLKLAMSIIIGVFTFLQFTLSFLDLDRFRQPGVEKTESSGWSYLFPLFSLVILILWSLRKPAGWMFIYGINIVFFALFSGLAVGYVISLITGNNGAYFIGIVGILVIVGLSGLILFLFFPERAINYFKVNKKQRLLTIIAGLVLGAIFLAFNYIGIK